MFSHSRCSLKSHAEVSTVNQQVLWGIWNSRTRVDDLAVVVVVVAKHPKDAKLYGSEVKPFVSSKHGHE